MVRGRGAGWSAVEHLRHWREMHIGDQLFYEVVQTGPETW
jgi:hypothetical protein